MSTLIEWTDETWNPLHGCSDASAGCTNCYAKREAHIHAKHPNPKVAARFEGLTRISGGKVCWTGKINLHEDKLTEPFRWRKPRRVFVNSQSDLFHPNVPLAFIVRAFATMLIADRHTFQVLTKRADRAAEVVNDPSFIGELYKVLEQLSKDKSISEDARHDAWATRLNLELYLAKTFPGQSQMWPPTNVWLGTSIEDRKSLARAIDLAETKKHGWTVFWSVEPQLEDICEGPDDELTIYSKPFILEGADILSATDWVIQGFESGPSSRPGHPEWARHLRDACEARNTPYFFKQWGDWIPILGQKTGLKIRKRHKFPDGEYVARVGKKLAGRVLDGRTHDDFPEVPTRA